MSSFGNRHGIAVAHSVEAWLPLTAPWIFDQIARTPGVHPIVLTQGLLPDGSRYAFSPVYEATEWRERSYRRALRRLGIRCITREHLRAAAKNRVAIVHSHFGDRGWWDSPIAKRLNARHIVSFYGYDLSMLPKTVPAWRKRYATLFDEADMFLCEGPFMADRLIDLGCPSHKVTVQPLGVDVSGYEFRPRLLATRRPVAVLMVGVFREKKGIPDGLRAAGRLLSSGHDIQVTIIGDSTGTPREEEEKRRIDDACIRSGLESRTRFLGLRSHEDVMREAYSHDILLVPSRHASDGDSEGGAPVIVTEAAATGMLIVGTHHCDIPHIVLDGVTGFLAPENDPEALAEALGRMIRDPEQWPVMGRAGRDHVERHFNLQKTAADLAKLYAGFAEA